MINILHVINGWPAGGIEEQTYLICKHLDKKRFKHFSIGYSNFDGYFFDKFKQIGVETIKSDNRYSDFKEIVKKNNIHIVHKQTGGGDCPRYVVDLYVLGIPLIETLHCPRKTAIPYNEVEKIIYTTEYTKIQNEKKYFNKMKSIQYSLDLDSPFNFEKKPKEKIIVGRLGRIVPDKRQDIILKIAQKTYKEHGDKIEFHVAGSIPKNHQDFGKWFIEQVDKIPNMKYFGFVDNKYDFWKTLDICINPVWETSFDIVFLEAMACGIPILTWDNSAAAYVVQGAGIITKEDINSLYEGLKYLISNKKNRKELGKIGKKRIRTKYSLNTFINEYESLYEDIWKKYYA